MDIKQIKEHLTNYQPQIYGNQREFSVLIPLVEVDGVWHILYEVRSQTVSQPGQTSFPGGAVEIGESYLEAALRETHEELAIPLESIEVIGELDHIVNKNQIIYCFVGVLHEVDPDTIEWNEEVDHIYLVPLDFFLKNDPKYYKVENHPELKEDLNIPSVQEGDQRVRFSHHMTQTPFYDFSQLPQVKDELLWGYTANMTHRLSQVLKGSM